jgi:uncharacterized membrane-anchored protein
MTDAHLLMEKYRGLRSFLTAIPEDDPLRSRAEQELDRLITVASGMAPPSIDERQESLDRLKALGIDLEKR